MNEAQRKIVDWWIDWATTDLAANIDTSEWMMDKFIDGRPKPTKDMARSWLKRMSEEKPDNATLAALRDQGKEGLEAVMYQLRNPEVYTLNYNEKSLRDADLYKLIPFDYHHMVTKGENTIWSLPQGVEQGGYGWDLEGFQTLEGTDHGVNELTDEQFEEVVQAIKEEARIEFPDGVTKEAMVNGPLPFRLLNVEKLVVDFEISDLYLLVKLSHVEEAEEPDNIVYEYAGTNDTIGGASAQGMYVAELRPNQLPKEGADLGICVGRSDMHYTKSVEEGKIKIFSIRTSAGKSKLCIEFNTATKDIPQVRGTGNRVPGFDKFLTMNDTPTGTVRVDELRLAIEFLRKYLKMTPSRIHHVKDLVPGIRAAEDADIDMFSPPSKQNAPEQIAASARAVRAAMLIANANPWAQSTSLDAETRQKVVASLHAALAVLSKKP